MKRLIFTLILFLCLGFVTPVSASVMAIGDPIPANSWYIRWNESGDGPFNQAGVFGLNGTKFEAPAFRNSSAAGWSSYDPSDTKAYAFGPTVSSIDWDQWYVGNPLGEDYLFYVSLDSAFVWRGRLTANQNGGWSATPLNDNDVGWRELGGGSPINSAVPEPATMSLLGLGLFGLLRFRRKVRNY